MGLFTNIYQKRRPTDLFKRYAPGALRAVGAAVAPGVTAAARVAGGVRNIAGTLKRQAPAIAETASRVSGGRLPSNLQAQRNLSDALTTRRRQGEGLQYKSPHIKPSAAAAGPQQMSAAGPVDAGAAQAPPFGAIDKYWENIQARNQARQEWERQQAADYARRLQEFQGQQRAALEGQIPGLEQGYEQFRGRVQEGLGDLESAVERGKESTQLAFEQARTGAEEAARKGVQQAQNVFAGLGTLDSSAFQQAMARGAKSQSQAMRQIEAQRANRVADLDAEMAAARRDAQQLIEDESVKLQNVIANIRNTIAEGSLEFNNAIANAYGEAQRRILDIQDTLDNFGYQVDQAKYQIQQEMNQPMALPQLDQLPAGEVAELSDIDSSVRAVSGLEDMINQYEQLMGPVGGRVRAANPWDTRAQVFNSQMRAIAQQVGRAMEGGVLRKEDEAKYRAILPQLSDTPDVARGKIDNVRSMLENQRQTRAIGFTGAGYDPGRPPLSSFENY